MILGDSEIKRMMAEGYFPAYPIALLTKAVTPLQQVYNRHRR